MYKNINDKKKYWILSNQSDSEWVMGKEEQQITPHFLCGFFSGLIQAALFNPWDRALYLSVIKDRKCK